MTPITETTRVSGPKRLLAEWLRGWFDGQAHAVGGASLVFPDLRADGRISFDQSRLGGASGSPLNGTELRIVFSPQRERRFASPGGDANGVRWCFDDVLVQFFVRSQAASQADANREADRVTDLLHAVMANPAAVGPLSPMGLRRFRPRQPSTIAGEGFVVRLILCPVQVFYTLGA